MDNKFVFIFVFLSLFTLDKNLILSKPQGQPLFNTGNTTSMRTQIPSINQTSMNNLAAKGNLAAKDKVGVPREKSTGQGVEQLHHAIVVIRGNNGVMGNLRFREYPDGKVNIRGLIEGLVKGLHGMHVHKYGDLSQGCSSAGSHFDSHQTSVHHGGGHGQGHTGDFGNILAGDSGMAKIYINDSPIRLHGPASIIGRAVLVHERKDDLGQAHNPSSHNTGNAGKAIACGVVAWDD